MQHRSGDCNVLRGNTRQICNRYSIVRCPARMITVQYLTKLNDLGQNATRAGMLKLAMVQRLLGQIADNQIRTRNQCCFELLLAGAVCFQLAGAVCIWLVRAVCIWLAGAVCIWLAGAVLLARAVCMLLAGAVCF